MLLSNFHRFRFPFASDEPVVCGTEKFTSEPLFHSEKFSSIERLFLQYPKYELQKKNAKSYTASPIVDSGTNLQHMVVRSE